MAKGLFGGAPPATATQALQRRSAEHKAEVGRAASAKVLASVEEGKKQQGPLPQVRRQ